MNTSPRICEEESALLHGTFLKVFHKVAFDRATSSRLERLVSIVHNIIELSERGDKSIHGLRHGHIDGDLIGALMVDCLCCTRAQGTVGTTVSPTTSSSKASIEVHQSNDTSGYSPEVVLKCLYALSHVLRRCGHADASPFMKSFVNIMVSRMDEIGHAISRIPDENVYEASRIKKILYLWHQEGILKGTGFVKTLLAWYSRRGKNYSTIKNTRDSIPSRPKKGLKKDLFEERMKGMEQASSCVRYMKEPVASCH